MESTLLPMAERLRHRRHEDAGCIFSSHSAMMLCGYQGASQVCSSPRRGPILLRPTQLHSCGMAPITPRSAHLFPNALSGALKKKTSKAYILAEKEDSVLSLIVFIRKCMAKFGFYFNRMQCLQILAKSGCRVLSCVCVCTRMEPACPAGSLPLGLAGS